MGYEYNIKTSINDKRSSGCLFSSHALSEVVNLFINTFLMAYIYSFNVDVHGYIFNVGIFNIMTYCVFFLTCIPISYFVDKTNRIWFYRFGVVLRTVLVVVIIFCGKELSMLLYLAGCLNGISKSFYFSSYNVIKQEMVSRNDIKTYSAASLSFVKIVNIVCPIILGALIDISTYLQVAVIVLCICLIQIGLTFGIKVQKPANSNYSLKNYVKKVKANPVASKKLRLVYLISVCYSAFSVISIALNVCIIMKFGSNFSLGTITSLFATISILSVFVANYFFKQGRRKWFLITLPLAMLIMSVTLLFVFNQTTLIIFNLSTAVCIIGLEYVYDVYRNGILKEANLYSEICEHHSINETLMNFLRVGLFAFMLLGSTINSIWVFNAFLIILSIAVVMQGILLAVYEQKFHSMQNLTEEEYNEKRFKQIMKILTK